MSFETGDLPDKGAILRWYFAGEPDPFQTGAEESSDTDGSGEFVKHKAKRTGVRGTKDASSRVKAEVASGGMSFFERLWGGGQPVSGSGEKKKAAAPPSPSASEDDDSSQSELSLLESGGPTARTAAR